MTGKPKQLNWENLKNNICPQCNKDFYSGLKNGREGTLLDDMMRHQCGFKIRERRYKEIVASMNMADLEAKDEKEENGGVA